MNESGFPGYEAIAWFGTGAIAGARYYYQPAPPEIVERTKRIEAVCALHPMPLAAVSLQFPLHHPAVASVVVGHERADEVERNTALLNADIPTALWAELKEERLIPAHAPTRDSWGLIGVGFLPLGAPLNRRRSRSLWSRAGFATNL